jgi:MFS family permease
MESDRYPQFRWFLLIVSCLSFVSLNMNMVSFAPLLGKIAESLGVNPGSATQLMAVFLFSGAIALIVGGFLCDRFGIIPLLIIGNLFGAVPALLMPLFNSYGAVFAARFCEGLAVGFCMATMSPTMVIWFPIKERGLVAGLMGTAVAVGGAIGAMISPVIYGATGNSWQLMSAWLSIVGWTAFVLAVIAAVIPKAATPSYMPADASTAGEGGAFKRALSMPMTWIGVAVTFFTAWCMQTIYNMPPTYLAVKPEGLGLGPDLAGKIGSSIGIAGIFAPIVGGILQDKVFKSNAKPLMYVGFVLCCLFSYAILLPFVYANHTFLVMALVLAGAGFAIVYPAITVYVAGAYPVSIVGKMLGLWFGIGAFGGAVGLFLGGLAVARFGNYNVAITLISLAGIAGFILLFFLAKPKHMA